MRRSDAPPCPRGPRHRHGGFTFLGLMFLIALMGVLAAAAATTWAFRSQREKEADLLFAGSAYQAAITRYAAAHARQRDPFPKELGLLLGGDDHLVPVRYLRKLYFDPLTGSADWGLVRTADGGIMGVYSQSERAPIRRVAPYDDLGIDFEKAKSYRDWVFKAKPGAAPASASSRPPVKGSVPGWNYQENGEPPPTWENAPPAAEVVPEPGE